MNLQGTYEGKSYTDLQGRELFPFIMSTMSLDRDDEIVDIGTLKINNFITNPIAYWRHNNGLSPIGLWYNVRKEGNTLKGELYFHELPDIEYQTNISLMVKEYVSAGIIKACSIGFLRGDFIDLPINTDNTIMLPNGNQIIIPQDRANVIRTSWANGVRYWQNSELIECSPCPIPSNRDALMTLSKAFEVKHEPEIPEKILAWCKSNGMEIEKSGRVLSSANHKKLVEFHKAMDGCHSEIHKINTEFGQFLNNFAFDPIEPEEPPEEEPEEDGKTITEPILMEETTVTIKDILEDEEPEEDIDILLTEDEEPIKVFRFKQPKKFIIKHS
jgi:hypothetical protein